VVLGDFADGHVIEPEGSAEEAGHTDYDAVDRGGELDRELPPNLRSFKLGELELGYHLEGVGVEDSDAARPGKRGERETGDER
jgi:hypothetical protein